MRRGLDERSRDPRVERAVLDVPYRDLVADKSATVRRIHEHFGLELSDDHLRAVGRLEEAQPSSHFAAHSYTPDEFGVDVDAVRDELADYYERFGELL